jgi:hypothetical protein
LTDLYLSGLGGWKWGTAWSDKHWLPFDSSHNKFKHMANSAGCHFGHIMAWQLWLLHVVVMLLMLNVVA